MPNVGPRVGTSIYFNGIKPGSMTRRAIGPKEPRSFQIYDLRRAPGNPERANWRI